jgi:hypothetical protein
MNLLSLLELPGSNGVIFATSNALYYLTFSGVMLLVVVGLFYWAASIRKPKKRKHRHHWHSASRKSPPAKPAETKSSRRRRRSEPPRNPTLAETRGLPPLREGPDNSTQHYQH